MLRKAQDLLYKYGEIDRKVDLDEFIDNSFVEEAMKQLNRE